MKTLFCLPLIALLAAAGSAGAETLPLPDTVVAFDSPEGEALFVGAEERQDYFQLAMHFTTQVHPAYCGPASMAMVLNAAGVQRPASDMTLGLGMFDQENLFNAAQESVKPRAEIMKAGMTLDEFGDSLAAHGLTVDIHHAGDSSLDEFRTLAAETIGDSDSFVVVNYLRRAIGQESGGHISPLAAYDADTDRFLILDVSRYKYPPVWVEAGLLFEAMNTEDSDNGNLTRGYVIAGN